MSLTSLIEDVVGMNTLIDESSKEIWKFYTEAIRLLSVALEEIDELRARSVPEEPTPAMLDVWNECMEQQQSLVITWPRLLKAARITNATVAKE